MQSSAVSVRALTLSATLTALLAAVACSDGGATPAGGSGGTPPTGGGTSAGTTSGGSASGGAPTTGGGGAATGGAATGGGGAATGGAATGGAGSGNAGTTTGGSAGSGGATGGAGGSGGSGGGNCVGRALSLSANGTGTDSDAAYARVEIDLMAAAPTGNASRTIEFWAFIKSTDWVGDKNEIYYSGASGTVTAFGMDFGTDPVMGMAGNHATLNPFTDGTFNVDSKADLGINSSGDQWVHIAMTWDGTTLATYVNGESKITSTGSGGVTMLATAAGPLMLGCNPENKQCFNGWFAELSVWNMARTAQQIKDNYKKPRAGGEAGLVGYWKLNDMPGSMTAADSLTTGTKHDGVLKAAAAAQLPTYGMPPMPLPVACP
jgi:hypothetical protein